MFSLFVAGLVAMQSTASASPTSGGVIEESSLNAGQLWPYDSCKALQLGYSYVFEAARVDATSLNDPECTDAAMETRSLLQQKFVEMAPDASDDELADWIKLNINQVDLKYATQRPNDYGVAYGLQASATMNCVMGAAERLDDEVSAPDIVTKAAKSACATDRIAMESTVENLYRSAGSLSESAVLQKTRENIDRFDDLIDGVIFQSVLETRADKKLSKEDQQRTGGKQ